MGSTIAAAVRTEEAFLRGRFGDEYAAYAERRAPEMARRFSLERAWRNKEYRALVGLIVAIVAARVESRILAARGEAFGPLAVGACRLRWIRDATAAEHGCSAGAYSTEPASIDASRRSPAKISGLSVVRAGTADRPGG